MNQELDNQNSSVMKRDISSLTLVQRAKLLKNTPALLLDTSSSMDIKIEDDRRRIDVLRDIVKGLKVVNKVYHFNTDFGTCTKDNIPEPSGGTNLYDALAQLKSLGHKKVVIVTDGEAEAQEMCLSLAPNFELQIIYVGSGDKPEFLDKLAKVAGGTCSIDDMSCIKELQEKLTLLLEAGNSTLGDISL